MRVCIYVVRDTVCCPACVANSNGPAFILFSNKVVEIHHFTLAFIYVQILMIIKYSNAGTVISPVFQSLQPFNKERVSLFLTNISNYSAHVSMYFCEC